MAYSTISKPSLHFNTVLYTGNGQNSRAVTGVGFQPDWAWLKYRNDTYSHQTFDRVRGTSPGALYTDLTNPVDNNYPISSFDSDGITLRATSHDSQNANSGNFVLWSWKAGNSAGSSNSDGAIASTVSVNTTAGFSIVKYTGNGGSTATIGHGLGSKPDVVIAKRYSSGTNNWRFYIRALHGDTTSNTLFLNTDAGSGSDVDRIGAVSDTTFTATGAMAASGIDFICYCFKNIKGYSRFAKYIGNNSTTGPFIYTGFKPAWVLVKRESASGNNWQLHDIKRTQYAQPINHRISPNVSIVEQTRDMKGFEFFSNGFRPNNANGDYNDNGEQYIYMAFAEEPLVANVGNSIPATAR